jgi:putative effector of murein hydrolase
MAAASVSPDKVSIDVHELKIVHTLEKFSSAEIRSFRIRPILSTSVTMPVAMNVAHTFTASAASSGEESAAKAGVSADPI